MSIRIDASGDYVRRTTSLPSDTLFTIMGWVYLVSDRTGVYRYFAGVEDSGVAWKLIGWNSSNEFSVAAHNGTGVNSGQSGQDLFSSGPTNGQWFYFALVSNGTGAGSVVGYYVTTAGVVLTATINNVSAGTEDALYLGNDSFDEWNNIRLANVMVYDAALTQAEIVTQMWQMIPKRRTNLHAWWPMFGGTTERLRDYSGQARDLTAGGTLTDEPGPPITFGLWSNSAPGKKASGSTYNLIANIALASATQGNVNITRSLIAATTLSSTTSSALANITRAIVSNITLASQVSNSAINITRTLLGNVSLGSATSGLFNITRTILSNVGLTSQTQGDISVTRPLISDISIASSTSGLLSILIPLLANVVLTSQTSTASINSVRSLLSNIGLTSTTTGTIDILRSLVSTINISSSVSVPVLESLKSFLANIAVSSSTSGSLDVLRTLISNITIGSTTSGILNVLRNLVANVQLSSAVSSFELLVSGFVSLLANIAITSETAGTLNVTRPIASNIAIGSVTQGSIQVLRGLVANIVTASITSSGSLNNLVTFLAQIVVSSNTATTSLNLLKTLLASVALSSSTSGNLVVNRTLQSGITLTSGVSSALLNILEDTIGLATIVYRTLKGRIETSTRKPYIELR